MTERPQCTRFVSDWYRPSRCIMCGKRRNDHSMTTRETAPVAQPDTDRTPVAWQDIAENMHLALISMQVGGCTCDTKSPTIDYHSVFCRYRQAAELSGVLETLTDTFATQLDAAVRAEREACAKVAQLRGSEANWLWNDNVEPDKNALLRDEAYAIEAAIRERSKL